MPGQQQEKAFISQPGFYKESLCYSVLSSTTAITDANGSLTQHVLYFAYGEQFVDEHRNSTNSPYLFNGKEYDEETGRYYYGARYYDPRISLWIGVDPLAGKYPVSSPYAYCLNNPIMLVDPNGKEIIDGKGNRVEVFYKKNSDGKYDISFNFVPNTSQETKDSFMEHGGYILSGMVEIESGRKYIDEANNSKEKIHLVVIRGSENEARISKNGEVIGGSTLDRKNKGEYKFTQITMYEGSAKYWVKKNKFNQNKLSAFQKLITNAIHEFHHAISELDISARKENRLLTNKEHKGAYEAGKKAAFEFGILNGAYE